MKTCQSSHCFGVFHAVVDENDSVGQIHKGQKIENKQLETEIEMWEPVYKDIRKTTE